MRKNIFDIIISFLLVILLIVAIIFTYQNINLKNKNESLERELNKTEEIKEEIKKLEELKDNYNNIIINNNQLEEHKKKKKKEISVLNNQINQLKEQIAKLE